MLKSKQVIIKKEADIAGNTKVIARSVSNTFGSIFATCCSDAYMGYKLGFVLPMPAKTALVCAIIASNCIKCFHNN